jgi:Ca2+-binding RTX toxin-like protein
MTTHHTDHHHPRHRQAGIALAALALVSASVMASGTARAGSPAASAARQSTPTCDGKPATIVGTSGADHLHGTGGNDVIVGLGGNDTIDGRGGDDTICGGSGNDHLIGGLGSDTLLGQGGNDEIEDVAGISHLDGGPGDDSIEVFSSKGGTFRGGAGKDDIEVQGAHDRIYGGADSDHLELESAFWTDMVLAGGPGHDTGEMDLARHSFSGPGYRVVTADLAAGTLRANNATATLSSFANMSLDDIEVNSHSEGTATSRKYVLLGTDGKNHLFMGDSGPQAVPAEVFGRGGDDVLGGGSANDLLNGGPGHDTGNAFRGHDVCVSVEVATNCEVTH